MFVTPVSERQVLDIGKWREREVDARLDGIGALAGRFCDDVTRAVDDVGIVAGAAGQRVRPGAAGQGIEPDAAGEIVVAEAADQGVVAVLPRKRVVIIAAIKRIVVAIAGDDIGFGIAGAGRRRAGKVRFSTFAKPAML